ncbi:hypothetical protein ACFLS1_04135 [Verrucomicrobiota bacterium]
MVNKREWLEAADYYKQESGRNPELSLPVYLHGLTLLRAGREKEGEKLMHKAVLLPLADASRRYSFLEALQKHRLYEDASQQKMLIIRSVYFGLWQMGQMFEKFAAPNAAKQKKYSEAVRYLELCRMRCLNKSTVIMGIHHYLRQSWKIAQFRALAFLQEKDTDKAYEQIRKCFAILPGKPLIIFDEIKSYDDKELFTKVFEESYEYLQDLCGKYPHLSGSHNALGWLTAVTRERLAEGLKHAQRAVELEPQKTICLDTLAEIHFQLNNKEQAIEVMKKCIKLAPEDFHFVEQLKRFRAGDPLTRHERL